jgi:hypothetical protein
VLGIALHRQLLEIGRESLQVLFMFLQPLHYVSVERYGFDIGGILRPAFHIKHRKDVAAAVYSRIRADCLDDTTVIS